MYDEELFALYNLFLVAHSTCFITSSILHIVRKPAPKKYKDGELVVIPEGTDVIEYGEYEETEIPKL